MVLFIGVPISFGVPKQQLRKERKMKKSLLLLATGLLATTSAMAMDVSNPFYVPMKGDFLSETSADYINGEHGRGEAALLAEVLSYGVTRNFSVNGTLTDTWLFDTKGITGHDRYDNPAWGVGVKYNVVDCCKTGAKVQVGANYDQGGVDHHEKAFSAYAKAGYQIKSFLPYATVLMVKPVGEYEQGPIWSGRAAVDTQLTKKVNLDTGVTYTWDYSTKYDSKHDSEWKLDATLNYVFSDCMSVGLRGSYVLDAKPYNYDKYTVGANFKVAF